MAYRYRKASIIRNTLNYRLPDYLEPFLFMYAVYLLNCSPNVETHPESPWQLLTGEKLDLKSNPLHPFGTIAVFYQGQSLRTSSHPDNAEFGRKVI